MHHIIFTEADTYPTALLIKSNSLHKEKLTKNYIEPIVNNGLSSNECIAFDLKYDEKGKCPAKLKNEYLKNLLPALKSLGVNTLFVCDSEYFKHLTKVGKADPHYGSILDCKIKGFEDLKVILAPNYQALFYNPNIQQKLDMSLSTLVKYRQGNYTELGSNIIHSEHYPEDYHAIAHWLDKLHQYPTLACDIETFSLKFWETGIGTIGFSWDEHNGIAFPVDLKIEENNNQVDFIKRIAIRQLLRNFFEDYKGKLIWHNANFDLKIIVNTLWMSDLLDEKGKLEGIEVMTKNFHDTKIITYLATNSTAGNKLGLKDIAHEFAGNWAESEINDITQIPKDKLLRYNLVDCLSTYYVFNKFYPKILEDHQEKPYKEVMLPSVKVILQMELTGMPVNMEKVKVAKKVLVDIIAECRNILDISSLVSKFEKYYTDRAFEKDYQDRKGKAVNPDKIKYKDRDTFPTVKFNPGSPTQLTALLYDLVGLPVIDRTDTKLPATGAKTLKKLIHKTKDTEVLEVLNTIIEFAQADKILGTFIKALEGSVLKSDGWYYLHGNFNIGGTVSGRLSSSGPNLQNLPSSGTKFAKIIKECFEAPPGKLFVGADFSSLEDRISALTTKDPQKLKVYTGVIIYELVVNGVKRNIRDDDIINFRGKQYTGAEFYEAYS